MPNKKVDPYPTIPNLTPAPKPKLGIGDRVKGVINNLAPQPAKPALPAGPRTPEEQRSYDLHVARNPERKKDLNEALNTIDHTNYKIK